MTIINDLSQKWIESGVAKGDTLLIHSNVKRTVIGCRRAGFTITAQDILNSFLNAVGEKGTLLLPLFNFDFANGGSFDIHHSPSHMGALTEAGRLHNECVRTGHPIYSFAVIGYKSKEFEHLDNVSGYSDESPFGILRRMNGKIASLDLEDQDCMTFYHHIEEIKNIDYRYFKNFSGLYTGFDGISMQKTYKLFVRDIEKGVVTNVNPTGELMWQKGLYKGFRPKDKSGLRTIMATEMFDFVANLIDRSEALDNLYSIRTTNDR
jgi:aminoglycoside 3-N-acetyltransferase